ncbi:MAG: hypothetical protein QGF00_17135 [Planctomycetota bacterium]|nr:hypothetical protein [Planctomycetota bacterium]MDP7251335.1 hypothetical protein [Planctomycetota bacterium]
MSSAVPRAIPPNVAPSPKGVMARHLTKKKQAGLSTTELLVILLLVLLFLLLMVPMFDRLRARSRMTECANNLRQIGAAIEMYTIKFAGWLPANQKNGSWRTYLDPNLKAPFIPGNFQGTHKVWQCPEGGEYYANSLIIGDNRKERTSENLTHRRISMFPRPTRVPAIADGDLLYSKVNTGNFYGIDYRHREGAVILFMDWRAEWIPRRHQRTLRWWMETKKGKYRPPTQ